MLWMEAAQLGQEESNAMAAQREMRWSRWSPSRPAAKPAARREIDQLRPLQFDGNGAMDLKKILVFRDDDGEVNICLVGKQGSINVPLARKTVADLVISLTKKLAAEQPGQTCPG
jgi:hypothetical protein